MKRTSFIHRKGDNISYGIKTNHGRGLFVVNSICLKKTTSHQSCFMMVDCLIRVVVEGKYPCSSNVFEELIHMPSA